MEIVENLAGWQDEYETVWLRHFQETGETDWKRYPKIQNTVAPSGPGVDLSQSRLLLVSTAGGYLADSQRPFDASSPLGDYSIRTFPTATPFSALAYAHEHYDHAAINEDPQVLLPLDHLRALVADGEIGELAPAIVSFSGYLPDVTRVLSEIAPAVIEAVQAEAPDAVLLAPA
jgi:hypothetical protein